MAERSNGPVCFRISADERALLELVADSRGTTMSAMARDWIMDMARAYIESQGGIDGVIDQARRRKREEELAKERTIERVKELAGSNSGLAERPTSQPY